MQTIELYIEDEDEYGVFAISLVSEPAIESDFVALSKQTTENKYTVKLKTVQKEKNTVVGYALIPDIKIPRVKDGKKFNITMSKETVAKAARLYLQQLNQKNVTSQHEKPVKGCCVFESWVVEDPKNDKVNLYNLEPKPKGGEWVIKMSLSDEEAEKVQDGEYNGFSIEAMFQGFEALDLKKEPKKITDEDILNALCKIADNEEE